MKQRQLGRTGIAVSEVTLGTWAFASSAYGSVPEKQAVATISTAVELGVNLFDTAPLYGSGKTDGVAEEVLAKGLVGKRDNVLISTKFGRNPSDDYRPAFHAARARSSVEESLRRLRTDRIDILFFHSPFSPHEIDDDVWECLAELRQSGKIRFIGHSVSAIPATGNMCRNWARERKIEVAQIVYNLLNREAEGLIHELVSEGVGVIARECLANGFLSGQVTRDTVFPENSLNARYSREEIAERVDQVERLNFLLRDDVQTMAQAALRWVLDSTPVSTVLTGAKSEGELRDCVSASSLPSFSPGELDRARSVHMRDFAAA